MKTTIMAAALALACGAAGAQQVYRCGNSYSQQPCPGGANVQVDDGRDRTQAQQAAAAAKRDAKAADAMEKARLDQERKAAPAMVMDVTKPRSAEPPREAASKPHPKHARKQTHKPEYFTAVAPGDGGKKKRKKD